jgi:hypothetical protein
MVGLPYSWAPLQSATAPASFQPLLHTTLVERRARGTNAVPKSRWLRVRFRAAPRGVRPDVALFSSGKPVGLNTTPNFARLRRLRCVELTEVLSSQLLHPKARRAGAFARASPRCGPRSACGASPSTLPLRPRPPRGNRWSRAISFNRQAGCHPSPELGAFSLLVASARWRTTFWLRFASRSRSVRLTNPFASVGHRSGRPSRRKRKTRSEKLTAPSLGFGSFRRNQHGRSLRRLT